MDSKEKQTYMYVLVECLLCIGLLGVAYGVVFSSSRARGTHWRPRAHARASAKKVCINGRYSSGES